MDGEWGVENRELHFLKFREGAFLMTNNILVKSSQVKVDLSFTVETRQEPETKAKPTIHTSEVFIVGLSSQLYRIKTFDKFVPIADMHGYGLIFFKSKGGYMIYLEQFEEQNLYNMQTTFNIEVPKDTRRYCMHEYLNTRNDLKIWMNFETETLHVSINDKKCIEYQINTRLFPEPKVAFTFVGYSSNVSPLQLKINETSIYKGVMPSGKDFEQTFHNDVDTFIKTLDKYDPLHGQNASFSNIMLTQVS